MTLKTRPLVGASFGAEIIGVKPLDRRAFPAIRAALIRHGVLLFAGADLTAREHLRFMRCLGPLMSSLHKPKNFGGPPEISVLSSRKNGDHGPMAFHSDQAHLERPCVYSSLYCVEAPKIGGATIFADTRAAYDALPSRIVKKLDGRTALNCCAGYRCKRQDKHRSLHPVFRTHPSTGRRAVFVGRSTTKKIMGLPKEESSRMLRLLFEHQERRDFIYIHHWARKDFLVFDNRSVIHGRDDFSPAERRTIRLVMAGQERPV